MKNEHVVADVIDVECAPAVQTTLGAIFVSMELSRSTWLITSLLPGDGERMSKCTLRAGDIGGLMERLSNLRHKALARTGQTFPFVVIQEAGLDGFWIHRVLEQEGIESHVVDAASIAASRRRRRLRRTGSTARYCYAACSRSSAATHASARWYARRRPRKRTAAATAASAKR